MENYQKTKAQLIEELDAMQQKVAKLESKIAESEAIPKDLRLRSPRQELPVDIEFIADFDVVEARGVNISKSGICFELNENLPFEMRFEYEGELCQHRAHLVWVKRIPEGGYCFGLEFVPEESYPTL